MKSILFASTALVAFAGAAAAQGVTLTGNAEMGIFGNDDLDAQFHTDIDVTFTMSGETDNGLTFGASVDLDESSDDDAFNNNTQGGETIFLSGGFGTITMGDTDGAIDWALTEVAFNSGSINDDETSHAGYNGNAALDGTHDGQILRYDYSFGDFGVALSAEIDDDDGNALTDEDDEIVGIGFKYGLDLGGSAINFGLGFQTGEDGGNDVDAVGASVSGSFGGGFTAGLSYLDVEDNYEHIGVGVGYSSGAISVSANYGMYDQENGDEDSGFGLSAGYDLGGGAVVQLGYGYSDTEDTVGGVTTSDDDSRYSFGVRMNF